MSYRHYAGGEPQRAQRHQQYDPFAESDRYGSSGGQGRRDDGYGREEPRSSGSGYGGGGGGSGNYGSSAARQPQGYTSGRSVQSGSYPSSHGYGSASVPMAASLPRVRESGFPSGIQESEVWRTNTSTNPQQRSSRPAVNYTHGGGRDDYGGPAWGGDQLQNSRNPQPSYSYKGAGGVQLGMSPPATQPVLMMVPQGSTSGLMGLVANPFAVQRQAGMQMITIPAGLNPNVFDQQHLMGGGGGGQFAGSHHQQQHGNQELPRSGRHSDRGLSSSGGRESRLSSSSRGHSTHQSSGINRRRSSPGRGSGGAPRNAVYRKPMNINPPPVPRKRVSDRADFGDRKKFRSDQPGDRPTGTASANSTPTKRPNGNQKRKEKRKRDAEAKVAATTAAAGSPQKGSPTKKVEQKQEGKEEKKESETKPGGGVVVVEGEKSETLAAVAVDRGTTSEKKEVEVVVLDEGGEVVAPGKPEEEKKRKSKYDDFPSALLVCKVCQKSMNDGASFESHLSGRAHTALVKIVEERFDKRAELLMIESRLAEEEIGIELERQRRAGKSGGNSNKTNNHCKMCDCNYTVNWGTHKISLGHRILKEFLHPSCRYCDANFVHRMDWLNHLFGLAHLRRVSEQRNAGKDTSFHESPTQEELFTINLEMNQEEKPANFLTIRNLDWKIPTPSHIKDLLQEESEIQVPEGEIIIPEEHDGTVVTGKDVIISTTGYCCKVCRTYMTQEKEVDPHCMGKSHFGMYVSYLKKLIKMQEEQKAAEEKAAAAAAAVVAAAEAAKKKAEEAKNAEVTTVDETNDKSEKVEEEGEQENMDESGIAEEDEVMELDGEAENALEGNGEEDLDTSLNESLLLEESVDEEVEISDEVQEVAPIPAEVEPIPAEKDEKKDEEEKTEVKEEEKVVEEEKMEEAAVNPTKKVEVAPVVPVETAEVKIEPPSPVAASKVVPPKPPMTAAQKAQAATAAARGMAGRGRPATPARGRGVPTRGVATPVPRGHAVRGGPARGTAIRGGGARGVRGSPTGRRSGGFRGRGR